MSADVILELVKSNNARYRCLQMLDHSSLRVIMRVIDACRCLIGARYA